MKHLIIRVDSTTHIGIGHVMRCIALGQAWQDNGGKVTFISHCESVPLQNRLTEEGFQFISINNPHPHPYDLTNTLEYIKKLSSINCNMLPSKQWIVLDGYYFDAEYQKRIKDEGYNLLCIDDYGHSDHYYADIVLNQNISADVTLYTSHEPYTHLLLGTRYALLRREFRKWQRKKRKVPVIARKILVTLGGGDPNNVTLKVIRALKQVNVTGLEVKIVVGPSNPNLQILEHEISDYANMQIIKNALNMPALMDWADIAVSAGGSSCWEIAFLGLPNIIMFMTENQCLIANKLHENGAALSLGLYNKLSIEDLIQNIQLVLLSQEQRKELSIKSQKLIDGEGAKMVCQKIK